jgi:anaerobic selenocysteine-containing dehydrogenase
VQFEPRLSQTAASADEWIPITPGSEGMMAQAIGRLVAEERGGAIPNAYLEVDLANVISATGISETDLQRLASIFSQATHPLAIPGGGVLGQSNGLETAQAVLALNVLVGNLGNQGGLFLSPATPVHPDLPLLPNSLLEVNDLINRMGDGRVKALFVHGINPLFELPAALGFHSVLANVPLVISFASFPTETSHQADYIFPDHTALESWGYQKVLTGSEYSTVSGSQPTVTPFYNTRATMDVLLAAVQDIGGNLATAVPYKDEVDFLQQSLTPLVTQNGNYRASEIKTFMALFQQYGGWWSAQAELSSPDGSTALSQPLGAASPDFDGEGDLYLFPFMSPILGDGNGANKPWLQETPDPTTTVMWNTWIEINPTTAEELGLNDDDVVKIISPVGEIEAVIYRYPAIRPDTIAVPF